MQLVLMSQQRPQERQAKKSAEPKSDTIMSNNNFSGQQPLMAQAAVAVGQADFVVNKLPAQSRTTAPSPDQTAAFYQYFQAIQQHQDAPAKQEDADEVEANTKSENSSSPPDGGVLPNNKRLFLDNPVEFREDAGLWKEFNQILGDAIESGSDDLNMRGILSSQPSSIEEEPESQQQQPMAVQEPQPANTSQQLNAGLQQPQQQPQALVQPQVSNSGLQQRQQQAPAVVQQQAVQATPQEQAVVQPGFQPQQHQTVPTQTVTQAGFVQGLQQQPQQQFASESNVPIAPQQTWAFPYGQTAFRFVMPPTQINPSPYTAQQVPVPFAPQVNNAPPTSYPVSAAPGSFTPQVNAPTAFSQQATAVPAPVPPAVPALQQVTSAPAPAVNAVPAPAPFSPRVVPTPAPFVPNPLAAPPAQSTTKESTPTLSSVPASPSHSPKKEAPVRAACGTTVAKHKSTKPKENSVDLLVSNILAERGYRTQKVSCMDSGYCTKPTELQLASFGTEVIKAIHKTNVPLLQSMLECGISANACNNFGDSIVGTVCKKSLWPIFECLCEKGCNVAVCDGFGRTPLHHAAWAGTFSPQIVDLILRKDPQQVLIQDKHGRSPMQYVRKEKWAEWTKFLQARSQVYWPAGGSFCELPIAEQTEQVKISLDLAKLVTSGGISPQEVMQMTEHSRRHYKGDAPARSMGVFSFLMK